MAGEHRIAVITPYYKESLEVLRQCHESVVGQGPDTAHLMIADGHPRDEIDAWNVSHVKLPTAHGDNGNTPRGIGSLLAQGEGYEFVAYLDADNWYHAGHLRSLIDLWQATGHTAAASFRTFHDLAGEPLAITEWDEDNLQHVDTSCLLIHRSIFDIFPVWLTMPRALAPICDRIFLAALSARGHPVASTRQRTVAFRTQYKCHYDAANVPPPPGVKDLDELAPAWAFLQSQEGAEKCRSTLGFWPLAASAA